MNVVRLCGVRLVCGTIKAILIYVPQLGRNVWFPRSQIMSTDWSTGEIVVTAWIWQTKQEAAAR